MDRYAVLGNPVAHSLSPAIHARFAAQTGEALDYGAELVALGGFAAHARAFFAGGARGANVTLPFKADAFAFSDRLTERAKLAGAVNTLAARDGGIEGDNTDGAGLIADLTSNLGVSLRGIRILLVGAGGAARGVVGPLLAHAPAELVIANRTRDRAEALALRFRALGAVRASGLDDCARDARGPFELVLNATSSSTLGQALALPAAAIGPGTLAYDMAYGPSANPFLAMARSSGARASDGLGMLVEQAAEAFFAWRGRRPQTAPVLAGLRAR